MGGIRGEKQRIFSKLNLEKKRVRRKILKDGTETEDLEIILKEEENFYRAQYESSNINTETPQSNTFFTNKLIKPLSEESAKICEGKITKEESKSKIRRLVNRYCHDLDIKLVFTTFKLRNLFSVKDSVPRELRSRVIYKFTCACCNACYIGETGRHFTTRVREHLSSDKSSHIFKHLLSSECCRQSCSADCFEILDSAPTKFQLKLKEAMHINWEKPNLNQQVHDVNLTLTL